MKKILSLLLAVVMVLSFAACSKDDPEETTADSNEPKGVLYGIYKSGEQDWFIKESSAAKAAAESAGYEFVSIDAEMQTKKCTKGIEKAIEAEAVGIIICIPDQADSQAVADQCAEANIPVVAVDDALEADGQKIAPWVGINGYQAGEVNGQWLAGYVKSHITPDDAVGFLLMTMDTVSSCAPRAEGAFDAFTEALPDFAPELIFQCDYDGSIEGGTEAACAMFEKHPEITTWLVTGANDEGCIGAARALENANLDENSVVVGTGAYLSKDEFVKENGSCVKASGYFSPISVGQASVDVLIQLINGEEPPKETVVDSVMVTAQNYATIMGDEALADPVTEETRSE